MKIALLICLFVVSIQAAPPETKIDPNLNERWKSYKTKFNKMYDNLKDAKRRVNWEKNLKSIDQHNDEYEQGQYTYKLGLNEHADLSNEEYRAKYLGLKKVTPSKLTQSKVSTSNVLGVVNTVAVPANVDWRTKGYVTNVNDQGDCGSCWAFSTIGSLEGQYFRKTGNLINFSEQQLVDCSGSYGNLGCDGGLMDDAFQYIRDYGILSESDYPNTIINGTCKYDYLKSYSTVTGYVDLPYGNETSLASAVATIGPISIAIDAGSDKFQLYQSGIYYDKACTPDGINHGVLVVGYGTENGKKYWLVKNSYGLSWGLSGYIKMTKDLNNQCGIATMASYPLV